MEYREYMQLVERKLNQMTNEEKYQWIYEYARSIDKTQRLEFLQCLNTPLNKEIDFNESEFLDFIESVKNEDLYFSIEYEDYYDEIYHDWEEKPYYIDSMSIASQLNQYIHVAYDYMYEKDYLKAYHILDTIFLLEFFVSDDNYGCDDHYTINDLIYHNILDIDIRDYYRSYIYCAIQVSIGCQKIYDMFDHCKGALLLTDVLSFGPEEINIDMFIEQWIECLMHIPKDKAALLLIDACLYVGQDKLLQIARQSYLIHPSLYKEVCQGYLLQNNGSEALHIAYEALSKIPVDKTIRAQIADMLLKYYPNDSYLLKESFLSHPTAFHCIRSYNQIDNIKSMKEEFMQRDYSLKEVISLELQSPNLKNDDKLLYEFLLGEDKKVVDICMEDHHSLGWSYSLKGKIIPLLLMLFKPEHPTYKADMNLLWSIQNKIKFQTEENISFLDCFFQWKKKYVISNDYQEQYIEWITREVDKRTEAVVGEGHRKSYHKSADEIIVLGEILLSLGKINDLTLFVEKYKQKYSTKRAFKSEISERLELYVQYSIENEGESL